MRDGKRRSVYGKSRQEVAKRLQEELRARDEGRPVPRDGETVGRFLTSWFDDHARAQLRPSTAASYAGILRLHLIPALGKSSITRLSPADVQRVLNQKASAGLSPRRIEYVRAVLRTALNDAVRWGLILRNPAALARGPRQPMREINPLSADQARQLLEAVRGDRLEALYTVALALGLRQGEALGLRWEDVDLDAEVIHVRHALQRIGGSFELVEPKSTKSCRALGPLPPSLVDALRAHKARQMEEKIFVGSKWGGPWDLVFTSSLGRPLHSSTVTHAFQRHLAAAGLPHQRFHDLRHACATLLLAEGVNPRVVMEILGHSHITLTLNTYSHVLPPLQSAALAGLGRLLSDAQDRASSREGR